MKEVNAYENLHAQLLGDKALVPRAEFERLVELARRHDVVELQLQEDDLSTSDLMKLADASGAFDFWKDEGENVYSTQDGEPV